MANVPGAQLDGMAVGPEGDLWFAKQFVNRIDRITPSGRITEFSKGLPRGTEPDEIVSGRRNDLWFTQRPSPQPPSFQNHGNIAFGKITSAGKVTEFPTRLKEIGPRPVVVGHEGNVWFLIDNSPGDRAAIGRLTPSGKLTEFSKGLPRGSVLKGLSSGPGEDLWFTLSSKTASREIPAIARITPTGAIREFLLPEALNPHEIVDGPGGDLWFRAGKTQAGSLEETIGRITPSGKISELSVPGTHERSFNLAIGPEGQLWAAFWSLSEREEIGRFSLASTVPGS